MTILDKVCVLIFARQNRVWSMFFQFLQIVERGTPDNVFLRVYFDGFRQSSRFNLRRSKQSSFYVVGVIVDSRGGGPLLNVLLRVYFDVFRESSCFYFHPSNQSSFNVFGVFLDSRGWVRGGGPLLNVLLRVYFNVFRQSSCFHFHTSNQS